MRVVGLDACRGKWLAVVLNEGRFDEARLSDAADLVARWPDTAAIGVDIPIGLPETPLRKADRAARHFVGERHPTVFPTFPEFVLEAPTHDDAKEMCVERGWPKPSIQSYGMRHRIFEIAPLATADERIVEVHPEVSFRALYGQTLSPKETAAGAADRGQALAGAGIHPPPDLPYPSIDVLDAAVAAWSAMRYARGKAQPFPAGHGRRIGAIWR